MKNCGSAKANISVQCFFCKHVISSGGNKTLWNSNWKQTLRRARRPYTENAKEEHL